MADPIHIQVSVASRGTPRIEFLDSIMSLRDRFLAVDPQMPIAISYEWRTGSLIPENRQALVLKALEPPTEFEVGPTHVLFLDDDMVFPAETMYRLLQWDKDIVAANYPRRKPPHNPAAQVGGKPVGSAGKRGLEKVDGVGFGAILIRTDVFRKLPMPHFGVGYWKAKDGLSGGFISEDTYFCMKAREAGFDIWIDHDLSNEVGHVVETIIRLPEVEGIEAE